MVLFIDNKTLSSENRALSKDNKTLSEDNKKALMLEHVLVEGNEKGFFNEGAGICGKGLHGIQDDEKIKLYLENTAVLKNGIDDL